MSALDRIRTRAGKSKIDAPPIPELVTPDATDWPQPPIREAWYGAAGEIVRSLEPDTEADPVALLIQLLVMFGNVVGRKPHFIVDGTDHYTNEFALIVGSTSAGRKGTSYDRVRKLFAPSETEWLESRCQSGVSSGEGLLWAIRDPIVRRERIQQGRGQPATFENVEVDPGEPDKRLLVYEPEFATVLKQTERQGNTASVVIRQLWDGREVVGAMSKNNPAKSTKAHVSICGHITPEELHRYLTMTETANGFGNRFLIACVRRSKLLPDGGNPAPHGLSMYQSRLAHAIAFARSVSLVTRHASIRPMWHAVYPLLTAERPGLSGVLTARAAPHVLRLSMIYAILDHSAEILPPHLMAAIALWDYCDRSVAYLFGTRSGNPEVDELLELLKSASSGLTRDEIGNAFSRHKSKEVLNRSLLNLEASRLARRERQSTGGRPSERWYAMSQSAHRSPLVEVVLPLYHQAVQLCESL